MSAFSSYFSQGRASVFGVHGQTICFQSSRSNTAPEQVAAIVGPIDTSIVEDENNKQIKIQHRNIDVPLDIANGGPSDQDRGGTYTIDGEAWIVHLVTTTDTVAGLATLQLRRPSRLDQQGRIERGG